MELGEGGRYFEVHMQLAILNLRPTHALPCISKCLAGVPMLWFFGRSGEGFGKDQLHSGRNQG